MRAPITLFLTFLLAACADPSAELGAGAPAPAPTPESAPAASDRPPTTIDPSVIRPSERARIPTAARPSGADRMSALAPAARLRPVAIPREDHPAAPRDAVSFDVEVGPVADLAAYEVTMRYDPRRVTISAAEDVLGAPPGRSASVLGPRFEPGRVTVGSFSMGDGAGYTGVVTLARFRIEGGTAADVSIERLKIIDTAGAAHVVSK